MPLAHLISVTAGRGALLLVMALGLVTALNPLDFPSLGMVSLAGGVCSTGPAILGADSKPSGTAARDEEGSIRDGQPKMVRKQGMAAGNVGCELQDKAGNLWFSTGGEGVYLYDGKTFTNFTTRDGLIDNDVSTIIENRSGYILFGTNSGLCKYDGKSFSRYDDNDALNKVPVSCLLEDKDGNLWLGTISRGVYRYDGKTLTNFLNKDDHRFNLGARYQSIRDIFQDRSGYIWFSSWNGGGVWRYDGKSFRNFVPSADYYLRNEDGRSAGKSPSLKRSALLGESLPKDTIADDMIFSITQDRSGNVWFATRNHGACRYDGKSFTSYRENEGFVSRGVYSILEDEKGNIWLTTNDYGVWRYDGKSFVNFTTKDGLVNDSVFSILEDRSGSLWFGTRGFGLSRYDGKEFTTFSD
jgi:ligand-binding sensor domain-containing protein